MATFRVVCKRVSTCPDGGHVTHVGTSPTGKRCDRTWSVPEVWVALDRGDTFVVAGDEGPTLEKWVCGCLQGTLRASSPAMPADDLDAVPLCDDEPAKS